MKFVNVGFNNMINASRVVAVVASDSAPAKRLVQEAKDTGRAIDCTCGRKTRCVVIMDSDHVVLSALQNETVSARLNGDGGRGDDSAPAEEDGGEGDNE